MLLYSHFTFSLHQICLFIPCQKINEFMYSEVCFYNASTTFYKRAIFSELIDPENNFCSLLHDTCSLKFSKKTQTSSHFEWQERLGMNEPFWSAVTELRAPTWSTYAEKNRCFILADFHVVQSTSLPIFLCFKLKMVSQNKEMNDLLKQVSFS